MRQLNTDPLRCVAWVLDARVHGHNEILICEQSMRKKNRNINSRSPLFPLESGYTFLMLCKAQAWSIHKSSLHKHTHTDTQRMQFRECECNLSFLVYCTKLSASKTTNSLLYCETISSRRKVWSGLDTSVGLFVFMFWKHCFANGLENQLKIIKTSNQLIVEKFSLVEQS